MIEGVGYLIVLLVSIDRYRWVTLYYYRGFGKIMDNEEELEETPAITPHFAI